MGKPRVEPVHIEESIVCERTPREVFEFMDRPANLRRALRDRTAVSLTSHPSDLRPGTIFAYRLRQWPVDLFWDVVVSEYDPPQGFTGVKARGFFPKWALRHEIRAAAGGSEVRLALDYEVPPGLYHALSDSYVIRQAMSELVREQTMGIARELADGR